MAQNKTPISYDPLVQHLADALGGARDHGASVGIKQNDETALRTDYEALVGKPAGPGGIPAAVPGLKALWNNAKANKTTTSGLFRSAKSDQRTLAKACVNTLKPRLGDGWTNDWQTAGFTTGSLAIPENPLTLLQQLREYFVKNPSHERADIAPGIHATAAACQAAADAITTASTVSNEANTDAGAAKSALEEGIAAGRDRLSGLREELTRLIGPDDERWYAFGFERPGDPETPETPENLTATTSIAAAQGTAFADWDDARRADTYRATVFNATTNAQLQEQLVQDSDAHFTALPVGTPLRIEVTALNAAGESPAVTLLLTIA